MFSIYETTEQGKQTRSLIVTYLQQHPEQEFSREELTQHCNLTYDQIRRQTKNLCIEGAIKSSIGTNGRRVYRLRSSLTKKIGIGTVCLFLAWSVPIGAKYKSETYVPSPVAIECS